MCLHFVACLFENAAFYIFPMNKNQRFHSIASTFKRNRALNRPMRVSILLQSHKLLAALKASYKKVSLFVVKIVLVSIFYQVVLRYLSDNTPVLALRLNLSKQEKGFLPIPSLNEHLLRQTAEVEQRFQ